MFDVYVKPLQERFETNFFCGLINTVKYLSSIPNNVRILTIIKKVISHKIDGCT